MGARTADAQGGTGGFVGITYFNPCNEIYAITETGDVWKSAGCGAINPVYVGTFGTAPVSTTPASLGGVKGQYR